MEIKRKSTLKLLAFILSVLMLIVSMPLTAFALALDSLNDSTDTPSTSPKDIIVLEEDKALREENVKHFKLSNGTTKAVIYPGAVHYKDENGNWIDIDNALTLNGSEYSTSNKSKIKFATKSGSNCLISIKDGEYKIDFTPLNTNKVNVAIENPQKSNSRKFEDLSRLNSLVSMATYANIYDGIDLEYILAGNNVKENIIVKEKQDSYTFVFELKLNKLSAMLENGAIILTDADTGEQKYKIPTPYMYDANGVYSNGVEYSLVQESKWKYALTVIASADWINEDERAFPVTIDPTIGYESTQINDYTIKNGQITDNEMLKIGGGSSSYIELSSLPSFPKDAYLTDAYLSLNYLAGSGTIGLFDTNEANPPMDYVNVSDDDTQWYTLNLRNLVDAWYKGTYEEYIICLGMISGAEVSVASSDTVDASRPIIAITYRDMKGAEPYWSFISQSAGNAGTGSINLATGNLLFEISTPSTTDSLFSFTPSLIYNSAIAGEEYKYSNAQIGYWGTYVANGFKANFNEALIKDSYINSSGDSETYYIWADSDGTEHYFIKDSEGVYRDEDGLQLTLSTNDNDITQNCIITDSAHNQRIFAHMSGTVSSEIEATWYLSKLRDPSGNELYFQIDGSKKPNDIKIIPNGQNAITMISPLYNANSRLALLWNNSSKEGVVFRHSTNPKDEELSTNGGKYLREAIYIKCESNIGWSYVMNNFLGDFDNQTDGITVNAIMQYSYDPNGYLTEAHDTLSGYKIEYTYDDGQVTGVTEYGKNGTQGQTIGINYETGYTEVRTSGSNDIYGDNDDIINVYVFDNQGRTITTYSTNEDRTEIYGASSGEYVTDNENAKNSIKTSAITGGSSANYLLNGTFETSNTELKYWDKSGKVLLGSTVGSSVEWEDSRANIYALKDQSSSLYQIVRLLAGDYTLSLNINTFESSDLIVKLMVREKDSPISDAIVEILPTNEYYASGSDSFAVFSFAISENSDYEIGIYLEGNSAFDGTKYISVDNIMLSKTTGAQYCNYLNNGSFESQCSIVEDGENITENFWKVESGTAIYELAEPLAFGSSSLKINGALTSKGCVSNTVYTVSSSARNKWLYSTADGGAGRTTEPMTFIVSGFGKATTAMMAKESVFALRAEITILNKSTDESGNLTYEQEIIPYTFDFNKATSEWQYVSGSFVIPENVMIGEIKLICEYSNNIGIAYFDNISLVYDKEGDVSQYDYYENGKLKYQKTGSNAAYYIYDTNGNMSRKITNRSVTDYYYENNVLIKEVYSTHGGILVCEADTYEKVLNGLGIIRGQYVTEYSYNSYGLLTKTETKASESDVKSIVSENTYYVNSNSKIFGALKTNIDSLGKVTSYFYDEKNGRLTAIIEDDETGMYYTYDDIGNLVLVQPAIVDSNGNPVATQNTTDIEYVYDENTNELEHIVANGTTYTFTYDVFGNGESVSIGDTEIIKQVSNANNGKLAYVEYANEIVIAYDYDELGRTSKIKYFTKQEFESENGTPYQVYGYEYDSNGNLSKFNDEANGEASLYFYDYTGRLIKTIDYSTKTNTVKSSNKYYYDDKSRLQNVFYYQDYLYNSTSYDQLMQYYHYTYNDDDRLKALSIDIEENDFNVTYTYDSLKRMTQKSYTAIVSGANNLVIDTQYTFKSTDTTESGLISEYIVTVGEEQTTFKYTYDDNNQNIIEIRNASGEQLYGYEYDSLDRLIRENNNVLGKTYTYTYDNNGNILSEKVYSYTTGDVSNLTPISTKTYEYTNAEWKDQLTSYNGNAITYDAMGNPLVYGVGTELTWGNVNNLVSLTNPVFDISYEYNDEGIRTSKTVNGQRHEYTLEGMKILSEKVYDANENEIALLVYLYDEANAPIGFMYRDSSDAKAEFEKYLFTKNIQGDIIGIYNTAGAEVVHYDYNAWGETVNITFEAGYNHIVQINPFRYRGYYFDSESGFYYLNSRYYDPQIKRFINADGIGYLGAGDELQSYNLYSYCENNPVMGYDPMGTLNWGKILSGANLLTIGISAIAIAATVATCGAAGPLMIAVAAVTMTAGIATTVNGMAEVGEGLTGTDDTQGYNFMRDGVYGGDTESYETFRDVTSTVAEAGSMICASYVSVNGGNVCFIAGTLVLAEAGKIAIENIEAGDYVWATNPDTNETELKQVVRTFENEATELVHVYVNGQEIICTNEHPFYSPVKGWTAACKLKAGDMLVTVNGEYVIVEWVQHELLESPIKVYNFEVEDFHTYYVGEGDGVLVHNSCEKNRISNPTKSESKIWKGLDNAQNGLKTSGTGKNKKFYSWDNLHNEIEVFDRRGVHMGVIDPTTGEWIKAAVKGRFIKL